MSIKLNSVGIDEKGKITKIATSSPVFCKENEKITDVIDKILQTGHRRIPIVSKKDKVVGVLTKSDILDAFLRKEDFNEKVSSIMTRDLITCDDADNTSFVLNKFKISRRGGFPVLKEDKLVAMISERDFVQKISKDTGIKVGKVMTTKPLFITPGISLLDCLRSMINTKYRRLPVVDHEKLVGIVTAEDLLRYISENDYDIKSLDEGIEDVMVKDVMSIGKDADLAKAVEVMSSNNIGALIVVDKDNKMEGIITERDILEELE